MQKLEYNSTIKRNNDLLFNKLDDEIVMMSISKGKYYGLDNIASRVYELIEPPVTFNKLIDLLLEEYDVDREQCIKDVGDFIIQLADKEIIIID